MSFISSFLSLIFACCFRLLCCFVLCSSSFTSLSLSFLVGSQSGRRPARDDDKLWRLVRASIFCACYLCTVYI